MATSVLPNPTKYRDGRLDVLRGLCLLNMVLVHLYDQGMGGPQWLHELTVNWFRFAAGGFIMTSGMCIGAIHYTRALDPVRRLGTYRSLGQRAGLVLLVHYFSAFLSLLVIPLSGYPVHDVGWMIRDVLYFYTGYELLLFYVVMLLAAPLMIEILRRFGPLAVLALSAAIFCVKYSNPYLSLYAIENHFPLLRWQLVFVAGVVGGSLLPKFDALPSRAKWKMLTGGAMAALCVAGYAAILRVGEFQVPAVLDVTKYPLSPLEVFRYATLTVTIGLIVDRVYSRIAGTAPERFLRIIGAQSLLLWVCHIYITAQVVNLRWPLAVVLAMACAWVVAAAGKTIGRWWQDNAPSLPRVGYVSPVLGSLLVIAILRGTETPADIAMPTPAASDLPQTAEPNENDVAFTDDVLTGEEAAEFGPYPIDDDPLDNAT